MRLNKNERARRASEFDVNHNRLRAAQIEAMIVEFDQICLALGQEIESEEVRSRISDPKHFAYPTYAKAARERRALIQQSAGVLRIELDGLRSKINEAANHQVAA